MNYKRILITFSSFLFILQCLFYSEVSEGRKIEKGEIDNKITEIKNQLLKTKREKVSNKKIEKILIDNLTSLIEWGTLTPSINQIATWKASLQLLEKIGTQDTIPILEKLATRDYYAEGIEHISIDIYTTIFSIQTKELKEAEKIDFLLNKLSNQEFHKVYTAYITLKGMGPKVWPRVRDYIETKNGKKVGKFEICFLARLIVYLESKNEDLVTETVFSSYIKSKNKFIKSVAEEILKQRERKRMLEKHQEAP